MLTFNDSDMMWISFWFNLGVLGLHFLLLLVGIRYLRRIASALERRDR